MRRWSTHREQHSFRTVIQVGYFSEQVSPAPLGEHSQPVRDVEELLWYRELYRQGDVIDVLWRQ